MARTPVGGRPIPGLRAPGSKPAGSSKQLKTGVTTMSKQPGPNMLRNRQSVAGGPGVNVNSQPVD